MCVQSARTCVEEHLQDGNGELYKGILHSCEKPRSQREGQKGGRGGDLVSEGAVRAERGDQEGNSEGFCPRFKGTPPVLRTPRQKLAKLLVVLHGGERVNPKPRPPTKGKPYDGIVKKWREVSTKGACQKDQGYCLRPAY